MKHLLLTVIIALTMGVPLVAGGAAEEVRIGAPGEKARLIVGIEEGEEYLHKLRVLPLVRIKSPPQLAIWLETEEGTFVETLYVTGRTGEQSWRSAPLDETPSEDIRRPEALPVWQHRSLEEELDGRTAATPKGGYEIAVGDFEVDRPLRIYLEVNHSTDFNERYPKEASEDSPFYSGGPWGSGQPSLVYTALLEPGNEETVIMEPLGHGSPDGSDGQIRRSLEGLTTARSILDRVEVTPQD